MIYKFTAFASSLHIRQQLSLIMTPFCSFSKATSLLWVQVFTLLMQDSPEELMMVVKVQLQKIMVLHTKIQVLTIIE